MIKIKEELEYSLNLSTERLRFFSRLIPEKWFQWLKDAHKFAGNAIPYEQIKK